ncbi:glycosyltransferase family 4 protein [Singulisphaera sp. Ch08]|uniref:Glycosyltransferase family 4 protein n=1 Tax=Singulisphaera sp. Ch08 TaxID=3120278 RepID=A0AAU7CF16_9BACT
MDDSKVRVCYALSYFHPLESGAERQALAQGVELVKRGHSVQVVTHAVDGLARDEDVQGIQVHRWVRSSRVGPLFAVSFVAGVIRALRRLRGSYDLIHTHQGLWEAIATGLGRQTFGGVPTLVQPASSGYYGEAEELSRTKGFPLLRRLILRNHAFAAISADIEDQWLRLGVPPERMFRMASGVDAVHYRPGKSEIESALLPRPRVMFTGRLHPQKNLMRLLDAWPAVAKLTSANLILVGQGPEHDRLKARVAELGIADRVQFAGAVNDPADILRAADLFVLPSVAEGMSNSLLEAMATALPCVASGIGGNVDLIGEGVGRLVIGDDPAMWSDALIEILGDRDHASRMGATARHRVETEFALPIVVDRYLTLYRHLLAERSTSRSDRPW